MENIFHPKRIPKPDVPPPRAAEYFGRLGYGLILIGVGLCFVVGAIVIILLFAG